MTEMNAWAAILVLLLEAGILGYVDRRMLRTSYTPFAMLSVPAAGIAFVAAAVGPDLGFVPIDAVAIWIWVGGLAVFWMSGLLVTLPAKHRIAARSQLREPFRFEIASGRLFWPVSFFVTGVVLLGIVVGYVEVGGLIGTTEFYNVAGTGLIGHASVFGMVLIVYLLGTARKLKSWKTLIGFALAVLSLIYGVKGWLFMPLIGALIYRILSGRLRLTVVLVVTVCLTGFVLFVAVYLLRFFIANPDSITNPRIYDFVTQHFFKYLFAGWLGQSEAMRIGLSSWWPGNPSWAFSSMLNILSFIFGADALVVRPPESYMFTIGVTNGELSNVMTLFGNLYHNLGLPGLIVYTAGLSILVHMLFVRAVVGRNTWIVVAWCFIGAMLTFGWFDLYFYTLNAIEVPVFAFILAGILRVLSRSKTVRASPVESFHAPFDLSNRDLSET